MLRYKMNLKNGIAKARMCMAACVAASTLTLGFTSRAAAVPEDYLQAADLFQWESFLIDSSMAAESSKPAEVKIKAAQSAEETFAVIEEKAETLEAERKQAEEEQKAREQRAAETRVVSAGGGDKELLASIIFCEAGNQSFEGQVAVGAVVMNRIASSAYPNTIEGVIYQPGQFSPAGSGWLDRVRGTAGYTASAMQAAEAALAGQNPIGGCLYFDQGGYGMQIGAHFFH